MQTQTSFSAYAAALALVAGGIMAVHAPAQAADGSSVQLYGLVDAYVGSMRRSDQLARTLAVNSNGMTTSYWGLRGSEDLGGGLKTLFVLESFFQTDSGSNGRNSADPFLSRNAWVGLAGGFGQVSAGRQTNRLFVASGQFDPFGGSLQFSPIMLQSWQVAYDRAVLGDSVWNNTVQYTSPTIGGFRADVSYGFGEQASDHGRSNKSLAINYAQGPFAAALVAQTVQYGPGLDGTSITRQTAVLAAASYDLGAAKVYGQWQRARTPDLGTRANTAQLGVGIPVGSAGKFMASVARTKRDATNADDSRRTNWAVGYDHQLSRRTDLYAIYLSDRLSGHGVEGSIGAGIRHRF